MKLIGLLLAGLAGMAGMAGMAGAQTLPDPTRPPVGPVADPQGAENVDLGPRLQSVFLPGQGRPAAIISGRMVRLGEKFGDGRLVRVTETEAVIEGKQSTQRLRLTPEVEKVAVPRKTGRKVPGKETE